jgi:ribosomal protein S18 acetylase RimI-like enzyme
MKKNKLNIRNMTIDDLPKVFHLGEKLFTLKKVPNLYRIWDEFEVIDFFQSDPDNCIIAEYNNKVAGFILATIVDKKNSTNKYGYLVWLGVSPEFSRQGIGSVLFDEFKEKMRKEKVKTLLVDTQADNKAACNFFRKKGFSSPQDHIYFTLKLD